MSSLEDRVRRNKKIKRRSEEARELRKPKYRQRIIPKKREDDGERRFRKYHDYEKISPEDTSES